MQIIGRRVGKEDILLSSKMNQLLASLAALASISLSVNIAAADDLPQLEWGKPVACMTNTKGEVVRVQCDGGTPRYGKKANRCLVASNTMQPDGATLERVQECVFRDEPDAYKTLANSGAQMIPAIAEAPPGYARSESGRAYQVKFDLLNRIYIGASWLPTLERGSSDIPSLSWGRGRAETGFQISVLSPRGRSRHDIKILEGSAAFSDLELQGMLFSYDYQHLHRRPAFWVTTFIGPPRVYPFVPGIGWGFRILSVNDKPPAFRNTFDFEFGEMHLSYNPWQSNDMFSHLRFELGADLGKFWDDRGRISEGFGTGSFYAGLTGAIKARFSVGEGGLHYIFADVMYLRPTILEGNYEGDSMNRLRASLAYEGIFLAINDQPLSARFAVTGSSRQDIQTGAQSFEGSFTAGIRFSFWAPPRIFEPLPEYEEP